MLTELNIRNVAVAEQLDLHLSKKLTVLTGETGAGKSIIVDSLLLALGGRAFPELIRPGSDRAEISAVFSLTDLPDIDQWLSDRDLGADQECILRRVIPITGNSRCYVNGHPVSAKMLKDLGSQLVELQGQHEYHSLLKTDTQRKLLDKVAGNDELLQQLATAFKNWQAASQAYQQTERKLSETAGDLDLLRLQQTELMDLNLGDQEWPELEQEQKKIANLQELLAGSAELASLLEQRENGNIADLLQQATAILSKLSNFDNSFDPMRELMENAQIQINELCAQLRQYIDTLDGDQERADWVEQRVSNAFHLARKYKTRPDQLSQLLANTSALLSESEGGEQKLKQLADKKTHCYQEYTITAAKVRLSREKAATLLSKDVTAKLAELGMDKAQFSVTLNAMDRDQPTLLGWEKPDFLIATNPGHKPGPLSLIASGGELSRINLAIRTATMGQERAPTIIFDEVDSGIGGAVAEVVGNQLRELADQGQILCITHLPQVAIKGHQHLLVKKTLQNGATCANVSPLTETDRIEEIARMLGGVAITDQTRSHAAELLSENRHD